jgi:uncharacterized protein YbaR (Trm112 family)
MTFAISADRLAMLRCPETGSTLRAADDELISQLNQLIDSGRLANRAGRAVEKRLDGGLIRDAGDVLYPIYDHIPVLLKDEGIQLEGQPGA